MGTMRLRAGALAGMMRAIAAVTPPIAWRMGAKRITMTAFAHTIGPSASVKTTMPPSPTPPPAART